MSPTGWLLATVGVSVTMAACGNLPSSARLYLAMNTRSSAFEARRVCFIIITFDFALRQCIVHVPFRHADSVSYMFHSEMRLLAC